jgi:hypothetical protein
MAVRRAASRALSAGERMAAKSAVGKSKNRAARRRIEAEKAVASKGKKSSGGGGSPK